MILVFGKYRKRWYQDEPVSRVSPQAFVKLKREALAQPILIDVLEIFSGKVIDIKEISYHGYL